MPLRLDVFDDPDMLWIANRCGCSANEAVGAVCRLWAWANRHLTDGVARGCKPDDLDRIALLRNVTRAMQEVGWIQAREDANCQLDELVFDQFGKWNAQGLKARALAAERQRRHRDRLRNRNVTRDVTRNAQSNDSVVSVIHTNNTSSLSLSLLDARKAKAVTAMTSTGVGADAAEAIFARAWARPDDVWDRGAEVASRQADTIRDPAAWWSWWVREGQAVVQA